MQRDLVERRRRRRLTTPDVGRWAVYGLFVAFASAVLFGAATPASKLLLSAFTAFQLAGVLYLGAGLGVAPLVALEWRCPSRPRLDRTNRHRLAGAVLFGGVAGPLLLFFGLRLMPAGSVSLLLNGEMAATAVLGVALFGEHLGRRAWLGVAGIIVSGAILSWQSGWPAIFPALLVMGACFCWGFDNNLTALIDGMSPSETTFWKGAIAGASNLVVGTWLDPLIAPTRAIAAAFLVGALCYGVSIALYVAAAHQEGATRTQAVFASAPFVGAALSWLVLHETVTASQLVAALLLIASVTFVVLDRHEHLHAHEALAHNHSHRHDDPHHAHAHPGLPASVRHAHWHQHEPLQHGHPHRPDLHHRHGR